MGVFIFSPGNYRDYKLAHRLTLPAFPSQDYCSSTVHVPPEPPAIQRFGN